MNALKILFVEKLNANIPIRTEDLVQHLGCTPEIRKVDESVNLEKLLSVSKPDILLISFQNFDTTPDLLIKTCIEKQPLLPIVTLSPVPSDVPFNNNIVGDWFNIALDRLDLLPIVINYAFQLKNEKAKTLHAIKELELFKERISLHSKLLYQTVENAPSTLIITDKQGIIQYVNSKFLEVTGYKDYEVFGNTFSILKSGLNNEKIYQDLWNTIQLKKTWRGELINKKKDGTNYWADVSIACITDNIGDIVNYVSIQHDITDRKMYEQDLILAKEKAEESDRLKSSFLAVMSHELRTPLNAVLGFSDMINKGMSLPEIINKVAIINKCGNKLLEIIESLFSLSMLQSGVTKLIEEEININELLEELHETCKKKFDWDKDQLNLELKLNPQNNKISIKSDRSKLTQLMLNFIGNALKFTSKGCVEFGCFCENRSVLFYVQDTGIGIPKKDQNIIFNQFRQVEDALTRRYGGVGLGLSICKEIADLLAGAVWVESEPGNGATFFLRLDQVIVG